jgi:hypothetical protein
MSLTELWTTTTSLHKPRHFKHHRKLQLSVARLPCPACTLLPVFSQIKRTNEHPSNEPKEASEQRIRSSAVAPAGSRLSDSQLRLTAALYGTRPDVRGGRVASSAIHHAHTVMLYAMLIWAEPDATPLPIPNVKM